MVKPRKSKKVDAVNESPQLPPQSHSAHNFKTDEISKLRLDLMRWYDKNKRELPWRTIASTEKNADQRAYSVLVSEMMLQQTQVSTVLAYFQRWMARWPTLPDLAAATPEQVNQMWAGLGYYSRGRRLHEIACKVHSELGGRVPATAAELLELPGVGRYTAGAVASIAFSERAAVVDGNVVRVVARLRAIGACSTSPAVTKAVWRLAEEALDPVRPGDFNQALMELGATVCTPKNPQCDACPLAQLCLARRRACKTEGRHKLADIEEVPGCSLCLSTDKWDARLGVMNYPRKERRTAVSQQETAVCVLHREAEQGTEFFLEQRPKQGLLANLWQFACVPLELGLSDSGVLAAALAALEESYGVVGAPLSLLGRVPHQFSHISQVYVVLSACVEGEEPRSPAQAQQWATSQSIASLAVPTGMKKVLKLFHSQGDTKPAAKRRKPSESPAAASKKNKLVTDFFKAAKSVAKK